MMDQDYLAYLALLDEVGGSLEQLCELARQKINAARGDNLLALDEVLKQEQAMSLSLRGYEQKRQKLAAALGLTGVPLSGAAARYPAHLQPQAQEAVARLQQQYARYRAASGEARSMLEDHLRELEKLIADMGGTSPEGGAGYKAPDAEPPKSMKTDFRA